MRAHVLSNIGEITNTIVVDDLDIIPGLVDASIGGTIGDSIINGAVVPKPGLAISVLAAEFIGQVGKDVDVIYATVVGNRVTEYEQAKNDAIAYKASGYSGVAPASVHVWATVKGKTDQWAADDILVAASRLAAAQQAIRGARLAAAEQARAATDNAALQAAITNWAAFLVNIKSTLGIA